MPFSYRVTSDRSEDRLQRLIYSFAYLNRLPSNNFVEYTSDIHEFRRIIYENILFLFHFRYTIMRDYFKLPNKPFPSPKSSHFQNEAKCKHYFCANAIFFFCMRIRIVFISMALHLASLWNRDLGNFGIAHHKFEHCRHPSVSVRLLCSQKLTYEHSYYIVQFYPLQRFNLPSTSFKAHNEPGPLQGRL